MITVWEINAFPFTVEKEPEHSNGEDWFELWTNINCKLSTKIVQQQLVTTKLGDSIHKQKFP